MMPMPSPRSRRISANRCSTSSRCRLLVGSSISTMRACDATARQISTTCCAAIGSAPTSRSGRSSGCEKLLEHVERECLGLRAAEEAAPRRLPAEQDVLGDRQVRAERQLLVDQRDAALARLVRRRRTVRLARQPHLALVGLQRPGKHVHQRALAGAVLADERVDLAGLERKRHAVERDGRPEALADAVETRAGSSSPSRPPRDSTARRAPRPRPPRRRPA